MTDTVVLTPPPPRDRPRADPDRTSPVVPSSAPAPGPATPGPGTRGPATPGPGTRGFLQEDGCSPAGSTSPLDPAAVALTAVAAVTAPESVRAPAVARDSARNRGGSWPETLHIVAWVDPLIDRLGHDARSSYVETFWLGVLGPSTTWFLRRAAAWLAAHPDGLDISLDETAAALGIGGRTGRHAPLQRALERCVTFGMAQRFEQTFAVRRRLPPLARRHLLRLPPSLQQLHEQCTRRPRLDAPGVLDTPGVHDTSGVHGSTEPRDRARQLALSLVRLGEDPPSAEQQLARWKIHPAIARDAVTWAVAQELPAFRQA